MAFIRSLFNSTFKTNPYLERAVMTGITRVSKESVFSDLNNPEVVTITSNKYETAFGFTEEEVFWALDEYGYSDKKEMVKSWYDGFTFGKKRDIYNPWSILNFLDKGKIAAYWANTSSNSLVGKLIREGNRNIKTTFEELLKGETIHCPIDEQIVYNQLDDNDAAIWSLLLASGYLKVVDFEEKIGDVEAMNDYMECVTEQIFSSFDCGTKPSKSQPERFYHGFVLGLIVDLSDRYSITSNRESGFGRYDVMIEPRNKEGDAIIIEFKVFNSRKEASLEDTVQSARNQIEEKNYAASLIARGIPAEHIKAYGFAFEGKTVLIG